ncbi:MAG: PAS domain S-box protein, partial [Anaerolineae bacterium]|nr:PAS domain S-box protein [Anaerolineae bacterium]
MGTWLTSRIYQNMEPSIDIDRQLANLEPLVPLVLGIHGIITLFFLRSGWWRWSIVISILLLCLWARIPRGKTQPLRVMRAALLIGLTWLLLYNSGGTGSPFFIWYFLLIAVYPLLLPAPFSLVVLGAIPLTYLLLWPITIHPRPLPLLSVLSRSILLLFLGWLIWSLAATLMRYARKREQSERRLALAMEASGMVVHEFFIPFDDAPYRSDKWASILGYDDADLPARSEERLEWIVQHMHPDDVATALQEYADFTEGRTKKYRYERRMQHKSGRWVWISGYAIALKRDEEGRPTHVLGTMQDITRRKQAAQELHATRNRLAGIINSAMDGIITIDAEQRIVLFNTSAEEMFDLPVDEALGQTLDRLIPERLQQIHQQHVERFGQAKITNRLMHHERGHVTGRRANGEEFPVEASISQTRIDDQPLYTAILRDISERIQTETRLQYQANLLENVSDAIIAIDLDFIIKSWNKAAEAMYGWSAVEAVGKSTAILNTHYLDSNREEILRQFQQNGRWQGEVVQYHKDGTPVDILASTTFLKDKEGRPIGAISVNRDITERKQAQEALRHSEQILQLFVENAPAAIAMFDRDMRYIAASRRYCIDYNLGDQPLIGRSHYEVVPELTEQEKAVHRRCLAGATEKADEYAFTLANGTIVWLRWEVHPWYERSGEIGGIIFFSEMITERKLAQEALIENQRLLREAQEYGRVGSWELDLVHNEFHLSDVFMDFHGLSRDTYTPEEMYAFLFPQDEVLVNQAFEKAMADQEYDVIHRIYRADTGEIRWVHGRGSLVRSEAGTPLRVVGSSQDITERKLAEEALRENEMRFRAIFEYAAVGIALIKPDNQWLRVNKKLYTMLGYSREELLTCTIDEITHPDDRTVDRDKMQKLLAGHIETYSLEKRYLHQDGSIVWGHLTVSLVRDAAGEPDYCIFVMQDITERKNLEEQYYQAQKMEAIGHLAGGIAHDFNNILVPIMGYAELGLARVPPDEQLHTDLDLIRQAAERAANLTRQILAFSRKQILQMQLLHLNPLIIDFQKMLQRLIGEDIILQTFLTPNLHPIKADKAQLEQVLLNLAINARDAMPAGGHLEVNLEAEDAGGKTFAKLTVRDSGVGIPADVCTRIYEPF